MKSIKVIVIGFILAVALVAWPVEYTQNITAGSGFLLGAVLTAWLGVRRRKGAQEEYASEVRRYTAHTMMKVVRIEESVEERWEHQEDGSDQLRRETVYKVLQTEQVSTIFEKESCKAVTELIRGHFDAAIFAMVSERLVELRDG